MHRSPVKVLMVPDCYNIYVPLILQIIGHLSRASKTMSSCCEDVFLTSYHPSEQDNVKLCCEDDLGHRLLRTPRTFPQTRWKARLRHPHPIPVLLPCRQLLLKVLLEACVSAYATPPALPASWVMRSISAGWSSPPDDCRICT
jgi:hypothetical protein